MVELEQGKDGADALAYFLSDGEKIIMTFSMKRALAIFQKDYKVLSRNVFVSSTLIMPLFFAVFYS